MQLEKYLAMLEVAQEIFNYMPIRYTQIAESEYVSHLWKAIEALDAGDEVAQPFQMMPYHLLFMMAVQYKIMRIAINKPTEYATAFTMSVCRDQEKVIFPQSVFDLTLLPESKMMDLFKIVGVENAEVRALKDLILFRNNTMAHARGSIPADCEQKIQDYMSCLESVQKHFDSINTSLAKVWKREIKPDDDPLAFVELQLAKEYLCPHDFSNKKLKKFAPVVTSSSDN